MHDAVGIDCSDDEALNTEGHDEEVSRWEQEQIRKGISIPQVSSVNPHPIQLHSPFLKYSQSDAFLFCAQVARLVKVSDNENMSA